MSVDLTFNNFAADRRYGHKFFLKIIKIAAKEVGLAARDVGLALSLVQKAKIKSLNLKYRGESIVTDVLSFGLGKAGNSPITGNSRIMELGDIFICLPLVKEQAQNEGIGLETKLIMLTIHGFLHLAGYDHERSLKERKKMFALQEKISKKCANI